MGIANIVNTSGGGGGSSEIITHLVNSVDGAGLRLASSASIKCNDVAANRFGTADFSIEFVISQNAEVANSDIFTSSADYATPTNPTAKSAAVIRWDVSGNGNLSLVIFNSSGSGATYDFGVSLTADVDKPTHFVVSADRSANAVLFRNGAEVASVDISASASENIGVGGYPAVVGLPNALGFKGNIYRLRTYSKLLSTDEAKNVFDRADVPTALVSNLLLDLDCAYADQTQSTVILDKGPNNQNGTLNGTITQTNVIKQPKICSVDSTDGAGLHLQSGGNIEIVNGAAQFGTSDFSIEFILNQEKENASESYIYVTHVSGDDRLLIYHDVSDDRIVLDFRDGSTSVPKILAYDMNQDFGSPTHYVITFDRSGLATLYKNGNSVASVDISALSAIDIGTDSSGSRIGTSGTDGVIGTFYRFRTWNKLVDANALFERADVPKIDQYGEQNLVDAAASAFTSGTYSWVAYGTNAIANVSNNLTITYGNNEQGAYNYLRDSSDLNQDLVVGKKYRLRITAKYAGGASGVQFELNNGATLDSLGALTTSFAEYVHEFTAGSGAASAYLRLDGLATGNVVTIDTWQVDEIGCVSDYQTQWANPLQSLTVQDASGAADGTCSASGVTQVQPVVQLNTEQLSVGGTNAKIGIGLAAASNPQEMLHIDGISPRIRLRDSDATGTPISTIDASGGDILISADANDETAGSDIRLATDGTTHLTIDSSGTVNVTNATSTDIGALSNATQLYLENSTANKPVGITFGASNAAGGPSGTGTSSARVSALASGGVGVFNADLVFETRSGSTIAERMRIASNGLATFANGIVTSEKGIMSGSVVIADEGVTTITPTRSGGFLEIHANSDDGTTGLYPLSNYSTKIFFDSGSSPVGAKITTAIGADVDLTTSDVTGTTGTNGKVTIATLSNVIKIENQKGGTIKFFYTITC